MLRGRLGFKLERSCFNKAGSAGNICGKQCKQNCKNLGKRLQRTPSRAYAPERMFLFPTPSPRIPPPLRPLFPLSSASPSRRGPPFIGTESARLRAENRCLRVSTLLPYPGLPVAEPGREGGRCTPPHTHIGLPSLTSILSLTHILKNIWIDPSQI